MLNESNNIFKGELATVPVNKEFVPGLVKQIKNLLPEGVILISDIGSAGFKLVSGDMDTFVDSQSVLDTFNVAGEKAGRAALKKYIDSKGFYTALSGRSVHVRLPISNGTFAQVDLFVVPNAAQVAQFHQHGLSGQYNDPEFKGSELFIMYSSLAKALGLKFSPFEGKLIDRATNKVVADDKDSVAKILLNPNATGSDLASVKTILRALVNDPHKDEKLAQARLDASKNLITLPESIQFGSAQWFRQMTNILVSKL